MKIRSILERSGGTKVTVGGKEYHFKPDENGDHVAEVIDRDHAKRFLSITEGYEAHVPDSDDDADEAARVKAAEEAEAARMKAEADKKAVSEIEARMAEAQAKAAERAKQETQADGQGGEQPLADKLRTELQAIYTDEIGTAPSAALNKADLIEVIEANRLKKAG